VADNDDDDCFATPAKGPMRGALARSLPAAVESSQQVGAGLTPKNAEPEGSKGVGCEGEFGTEVADDDRANLETNPVRTTEHEDAGTNQDAEMGESGASPDRPSTPPSPTPARWSTQTPRPVPVTPGKGSKKRALAVGTPRPARMVLPRRRQVGLPAHGWSSGAGLAEILAAMVAAEKRVEEKMEAKVAEAERKAEERHRQLLARMMEMEEQTRGDARVCIEDVRQRGHWEVAQWQQLGEGMEDIRKGIEEVGKRAAEGYKGRELASQAAALVATAVATASPPQQQATPQPRAAATPPSTQRGTADRQQRVPPPAPPPPPPAPMEGVVRTPCEADEIEEFLDKEGGSGRASSPLVTPRRWGRRSPARGPQGRRRYSPGEVKGKGRAEGWLWRPHVRS